MSVINTNITSMIGQQNLNSSRNDLQTSMERLSSGLRINSAKDDAAGQAIANRMTAQTTGLAQAQRNANDGISLAQTAEGGLDQVNDNLQRIRELTVQAQNGTNSASDIDSIQQEVNERLAEIDRIASETDFNGSKILSKETSSEISIQVGSEDNQTISINISGNTSWNKFAESGEAGNTPAVNLEPVNGDARSVAASGFDVLSKIGGGSVTTSGIATLKSDNTGSGNGVELTAADVYSYTDANGDTAHALRTAGGDEAAYAVTFEEDGSVKLGGELTGGNKVLANNSAAGNVVADGATVTIPGESNALSTLDDALNAVDDQRSQLGAVQNRFESAITNLSTNETNISAAKSRIEDADYATEVANMTKNQILQQAGTSVLAQANQLPQSVLSLLG